MCITMFAWSLCSRRLWHHLNKHLCVKSNFALPLDSCTVQAEEGAGSGSDAFHDRQKLSLLPEVASLNELLGGRAESNTQADHSIIYKVMT